MSAHSGMPMKVIVSGWAMNLRQASPAASTNLVVAALDAPEANADAAPKLRLVIEWTRQIDAQSIGGESVNARDVRRFSRQGP
jgi:hypothetical protein